MSMIAYVLSGLAGLYGLAWLIFAFVEPPSSLRYFFGPPAALQALPDRGARFVMAVVCFAVAAFSSFVVGRFV